MHLQNQQTFTSRWGFLKNKAFYGNIVSLKEITKLFGLPIMPVGGLLMSYKYLNFHGATWK